MRRLRKSFGPAGGRATALALIILVQAVCSLFFIGDVATDVREGDSIWETHLWLEAVAALALIAGVAYLMVELRRILTRMEDMDAGLKIARGELQAVTTAFFGQWGLTPAEQDVAIMVLKGVDNETIAEARGTAVGTVRAQTARIYAKSGAEGRAQFISLFMEELLSGEFGAPEDRSKQARPGDV